MWRVYGERGRKHVQLKNLDDDEEEGGEKARMVVVSDTESSRSLKCREREDLRERERERQKWRKRINFC